MDHAPGTVDGGDARREVPVGRRVFLGMIGLGAAGVVLGAGAQSAIGKVVGSGVGALVPGGDHFRLYTVTGSFPRISPSGYRLEVSGLVLRPVTLSLSDIESMPSTRLVDTFQCVTGWRVPRVHWEGVRLGDLLDAVGVKPGAVGLDFESYDRLYTESLSLDQARLGDVLVAYRMLGAPVTTDHGGPVRLYVNPMFGYKSIKWLSAIRVVDRVTPGFWEQNGYPVNAWRDGSTGPTDSSQA